MVMHNAVLEPLAEVADRHGLDPLATRLWELRSWLGQDLTELEHQLNELATGVTEDVSILPGTRVRGAAVHLVGLPGKRIRPLCVLLAARLGGVSMDRTVQNLAVACELVHAATLLHDDVIDNS